ncbi:MULTISPECIES: SPFH domain-containing protein [unclassified Saccharothrix]|uniref:SPFH domain-containing protein n=1 Tax=unclassified Saccharothrix TaxID=2593673 RepID=UPI00307DE6BE
MKDVVLVAVLWALPAVAFLVWLGATGWWRLSDDEVGVVERRFGKRRPDDDPVISLYGAKGVQAGVIAPNSSKFLPKFLFDVHRVPLTRVPNGTVGVVVAHAGRPLPLGQSIAKHVECNHFQDAAAFLHGGGEQGRQQQVLPSGTYRINTRAFTVITVDRPEEMAREHLTEADLTTVDLEVGEAGVVITRMGAKPDPDEVGPPVDGHLSFQLPWVFAQNGGRLGVQRETLDGGGRYSLNPWFAQVVKVPTRVLILEWNREHKPDDNLDASLEQIVLDVQGYTVRLDMKQTVQIPPEVAPNLVQRFGTRGPGALTPVQQFVQKDLAPTVKSYFLRKAAGYRIQEFITKYSEVSNDLAAAVRQAMEPIGVKAIRTTLEEFECDQQEINDLRREIANQEKRAELEAARLAELKALQVNEEVRVAIQVQAVRVEEERAKLGLLEIRALVELLGPAQVATERIVRELAKAPVPQVIGGNGDMAQQLLSVMPIAQARDMLMGLLEQNPPRPRAVGE